MEQKDKINLIGLRKNVSLKDYSTYKIGGLAKYFFEAKEREDLKAAIEFVKNKKIPFFILGAGSNVLFSDQGFKGLVIKCDIQGIKSDAYGLLHVESGTRISELSNFLLFDSLTGFEWANGIPGTVGGAIRGNAQAFGSKMSDAVQEVEFFDAKKPEFSKFYKDRCRFSTKSSVFKEDKNLIIISAILKFERGDKDTIRIAMEKNLEYRKNNHPMNFPSAGSVFINPEKKIKNKKLLKEFPELKKFNQQAVISAAFLVEKCGLKGERIGDAQISEKHANFIINLGDAKAKEVLKLISLAKRRVKNKFNITLKEEIEII